MLILPIKLSGYEMYENDKIDIIEFNENSENYEYEGYIEIPKFGIKRMIKKGKTEEILESNLVLYYNSFINLDKNNFNIILLGHNIESVFRFLHYLEIGDDIILVTHKKCYSFKIYSINVISENETYVLNEKYDEKTLTLITCMKNNKNRLILHAKVKNVR